MTKPSYYHQGNIDVITFAEENFTKEELKGFYRMNVLKYVTRFDKKGSALSDLEKAAFYLDKLKAMENKTVNAEPIKKKETFENAYVSFLGDLRKISGKIEKTDWVNYFVPNEND